MAFLSLLCQDYDFITFCFILMFFTFHLLLKWSGAADTVFHGEGNQLRDACSHGNYFLDSLTARTEDYHHHSTGTPASDQRLPCCWIYKIS